MGCGCADTIGVVCHWLAMGGLVVHILLVRAVDAHVLCARACGVRVGATGRKCVKPFVPKPSALLVLADAHTAASRKCGHACLFVPCGRMHAHLAIKL
jgi:hypothetical protein